MIANLHQEGYPLTALCQTLQVSRSGYYAFEQDPRFCAISFATRSCGIPFATR